MFASTLRRLPWILCFCAAGPTAFGQAEDASRDGLVPVSEAAAEAGLAPGDWMEIQAAYEQGRSPTNGVEDASPRISDRATGQAMTSGPIVQQQAYLKASNTDQGDGFGVAVSVSGDTVVVGASGEGSSATGVNGNQNDESAIDSGAVYVFVRRGTTWTQQAYLKASNTGAFDYFGAFVSVAGDTVVVGAPGEASRASGVNGDQTDNSLPYSGAAYIFVRTGTSWSQQAYLKARNSGWGDRFGVSVAVSGNTVVVGAPREDSDATGVNGNGGNNRAVNSGAAYVFVRNDTIWIQQAYLKASNTDSKDKFGISAAIWNDTVVVGALNESSNATGVNGNQSDNSAPSSGAAYVFVRNGTTWSQEAYLKASNTEARDFFGGSDGNFITRSVGVYGDTIVVGALGEDSGAIGVDGDQNNNNAASSGAAYLFVQNGTIWNQQSYLKASNTAVGARFGASVSASDNTVLIGAWGHLTTGAAYYYGRLGSTWTQRAYLTASTIDFIFDYFGVSVSHSADTLVVGALGEDSAATGVNGDETDNSLFDPGAAYLFEICPPFPPLTYCAGKTSSGGCVPFVSFSGMPSASTGPFDIFSNNHVEAEPGIYLYSVLNGDLSYHGGKLCVKAPFRRLTTLIKAVDGSACTGCAGNCRMFKRDFNQWIQAGTDPMLTPGQQVHVQVRQSDPANIGLTGFGDNLSDALLFTIGL